MSEVQARKWKEAEAELRRKWKSILRNNTPQQQHLQRLSSKQKKKKSKGDGGWSCDFKMDASQERFDMVEKDWQERVKGYMRFVGLKGKDWKWDKKVDRKWVGGGDVGVERREEEGVVVVGDLVGGGTKRKRDHEEEEVQALGGLDVD